MAKSTKQMKIGEYVRLKKGPAVVIGVRKPHDWESEQVVYIATVDRYGYASKQSMVLAKALKLPKIKAPEYVVVWSDQYSDPFTQFETRAQANAFAAKLRKRKNSIAEVRVYKLTK